MRVCLFLIIVVLFFFTGCAETYKMVQKEEELIFQSGFEPESKVIPRGNDADITGTDNTLDIKNDWVRDLDENQLVGNFNIQYQGGDASQRFAKIIPEPGNPENHVLWFWLDDANVEGTKGRIQANIYQGTSGLKEYSQSMRIFLPEDMNFVRTFPEKISWLTIVEIWNNITWSQRVPYGFRVTLGIGKPDHRESDLFFIIDGQDCELFEDGRQKYTTLWADMNKRTKVPIGKWFTLDYYFKEGNAANGRFYMTMTPENGTKITVFDIKNLTHNSHNPNPNGVTDFNPLKLYTSRKLIDHMKSNGKSLQIYFDDFKLWKGSKP
ncbi:MAG: hypothetical protein JJU28_20630 [Cyclobacteriaceae bacterium]|nr:hypothetical protein [Cyclobacteriaceae bacterium]